MLHPGNEHFIARPEAATPGLCDEVDGFGRTASEDDFFDIGRVEEATHPLASTLEGVGGFLTQLVHAAVYVGMTAALVTIDRLDHGERSLCRGRSVEKGQPLAAHGGRQNRKIGAHARHVVGGHRHFCVHDQALVAAPGNCRSRAAATCDRNSGEGSFASTSLTNAHLSRDSAVAGGMPRDNK